VKKTQIQAGRRRRTWYCNKETIIMPVEKKAINKVAVMSCFGQEE
jgi:hypothetical protein